MTYSGTIAAAIEATIWATPAIAVSLDKPESILQADYSTAAQHAVQIAENIYQNGLSRGTLLNVNVPFLKVDEIKGYQVTRQGTRIYSDVLQKRSDPRGRPYFWVIGNTPTGVTEPGTDIAAVADGYVSVTPLRIDLTDLQSISELMAWDWKGQQTVEKRAAFQQVPVTG